jgi:hypothetical protein
MLLLDSIILGDGHEALAAAAQVKVDRGKIPASVRNDRCLSGSSEKNEWLA